MACKICGDTKNVIYRDRSMMFLCNACHRSTPKKYSYVAFLSATGLTDSPTAREFYADYKASTHVSVREYWAACSAA